MIKDKTFDYLLDGEKERAAHMEGRIYECYAAKLQPLGITAADLFPEIWTELATNWTAKEEQAAPADDQGELRTTLNFGYYGYLRRQALSRYIAADRSAADCLADALDILAGITPRDLEIVTAVRNILDPEHPTRKTAETFSNLIDRATVDALICRQMHGGNDEDAAPFYAAREKKIHDLFPESPPIAPYASHSLIPVLKLATDLNTKTFFSGKTSDKRINKDGTTQAWALTQMSKGKREPLKHGLTPFDGICYQIANSEIEAGNTTLYPLSFYRKFNPDAKTVPADIRKRIEESLELQRQAYGTVIRYIEGNELDENGEKKRKIEESLDAQLLEFARADRRINGGLVKQAYLFRTPSFWYQQAKKNGTGRPLLQQLEINALKIKGRVSLRKMEIQARLTQRLADILGGISRTIKYEPLYMEFRKNTSNPDAMRKETSKLHAEIKGVFDSWKENGIIKDYTEKRKGRTHEYVSAEIILPRQTTQKLPPRK